MVAIALFAAFAARRPPANPSGRGWDSGYDARALADTVATDGRSNGWGWARLRGAWLVLPADKEQRRTALLHLRRAGVRTVVFGNGGRWSTKRASGYVPGDLREGFQRSVRLGQAFGLQIDAWEIENEPDLIYVPDNPESYVAYLKALYLGLNAGVERAIGWSPPDRLPTAHGSPRAARVLKAPMGLPPGTYFEALLDNDLLSYTDGFNFHYYGYAQDFPGAYRLYESAVLATSEQTLASSDQRLATRKSLPIFLTEYGYGTLSGPASASNEGRVRQWRFFRQIAEHMRALQIEAPMAFYLRPYFEQESREYGLTMLRMRSAEAGDAAKTERLTSSATNGEGEGADESDETLTRSATGELATRSQQLAPRTFRAGSVEFRPADFGATEVEPWMRDIGRKIGDAEASPAMAWLMNQPGIAKSRPWVVRVPQPSPVVIDFVAGAGMFISKNFRGNFLIERTKQGWRGTGELRVYNFDRTARSGTLRVRGAAGGLREMPLRLLSGEMHRVPLEFESNEREFRGDRWTAEFVPDQKRVPPAIFSSWVYPNYAPMAERLQEDFAYSAADSHTNAAIVDQRPLAAEEERVHAAGRWRVTQGLSVSETEDTWRFTVTGFPDEPMRPAVAELPLRDGFRFGEQSFFRVDTRLLPRTIAQVEPALEPRADLDVSGLDREAIGLFVRVESGMLFWMSAYFPATTTWKGYTQHVANFNAFTYSRLGGSHRLLDHKPVSLVIQFRPRLLPAVYEIRKARVVELFDARD